MEYKEMLDRAREKYNGSCKVCRVCDGVACRGQVPGMGGKGTGKAFIENVEALDRILVEGQLRLAIDLVLPRASSGLKSGVTWSF